MRGRRHQTLRDLILAGLLAGLPAAAPAQDSPPPAEDALEAGFKSPPDTAKPRVWWHWTNGNVTREGITLDLEWMKRVGIGGTAAECDRLGRWRGLGRWLHRDRRPS